MDIFKTELLSDLADLPNDILDSSEFNKYVCEINSDKKKKYTEIEIKNILYCLDYSYHVLGKALIPDEKFERLEMETKEKYPDTVLYSEKHMSQTLLPCPMPSLTKFYNTEFDKIKNKIKNFNKIVISSKLDGVSCLLIKTNKVSLYTKGDGEKGRNISHILNYINLDMNKIPNKTILRGELVIKKEDYNKFSNKKALRSQVIGLINRDFSKEIDEDSINLFKLVDIVFYHVIKPKNFSFYQQFIYLEKLGLKVPLFVLESTEAVTRKFLEITYDDFLNKEKYNIDGLVISESEYLYDLRKIDSNYHNLLFAFKQNKHFAVTTINKIEWQTSKNCYLIPVLFCEPVILLGNKITKISGFNAKNVINKQLGVNAKISVTLAGNVIPSIDTVLEPSDNISLPSNIRWEGVHIISTVVNFASISKVIEKYFIAFNIKGISNKTIFNILVKLETKQIIVSDIFSFFTGIEEWFRRFSDTTLLGEKKDIQLRTNLAKMKETPISIVSILVATNYFHLISDVKMKAIFEECQELYKYILGESELDEDELMEKLLSVVSIADKVANNILRGINMFRENKLLFDENFKIIYDSVLKTKKCLPRVVFTEVKNFESYLQTFEGCFILSLSLTKDVNYLVTPNNEFKPTTKYYKAQQYNIKIITLKEFKELMYKKKLELAL